MKKARPQHRKPKSKQSLALVISFHGTRIANTAPARPGDAKIRAIEIVSLPIK
jgi:hypothetical protein